MKAKISTLLPTIALCTALPSISAGAEGIGVVTGIRGEATVRRAPAPGPQKVSFKDDVFWLDTLNTGADSRLRLLILQKSVITMKELSQLELREEAASPTQPKRKSILNVVAGAVRTVVDKDALRDTDYEVHTNLAVAAIRGSDLITERPGQNEVNYYTGPRASAGVAHTNPAVGSRDVPELTRARVGPNSIDLTPITESQYRSLAGAIAPRGPQARGHRAEATLPGVEAKIIATAVGEAVRTAVAAAGIRGVLRSGPDGAAGDPTAATTSPTAPTTTTLVVPSTTGISNGVSVISYDGSQILSSRTFSETFSSAADTKSFDVTTSGTKWFVSVRDCCIAGDKWQATIFRLGKELTSVTGDGGTSAFSERTGVATTGSKDFTVKVTYTTGVDIFPAGMDVKFDTTQGTTEVKRKSPGEG